MVYTDKQWSNFLAAIDMQELPARDPRFATFEARLANINHVYDELARTFTARTTAEWLALLERADVPCMPMHDLESILDDAQLAASGFFEIMDHPTEGKVRAMHMPIAWSQTPVEIRCLAPRRGQDGDEILRQAGFTADAIDRLRADGVLSGGEPPATAQKAG